MSPRTGRPPSEHPKNLKIEARMSQLDLDKLDFCCNATGKSKSDILRDGIDAVYQTLKETEN